MLNHAQLARADINLLLLFDLLFEEGNAGRAADKLHLSPSAVSHALKRLRRLLDDPLFLPTSKGMVPTERARTIAPAVRDIVERVAAVVASSEPFDPRTTARRFRIGAPDGAVSALLPRLIRRLRAEAPGIDLALVQLLPNAGQHAWQDALAQLDAHRIDIAILPHDPQVQRFYVEPLYDADFVIVAAQDHPWQGRVSIEAFAAANHIMVSATGDSAGLVDALLDDHGHSRRIAVTVPNFFMAVAAVESSDLVAALPRRFAVDAARHFAVKLIEPPFVIGSAPLNVIVPRAALLDEGLAWMVRAIAELGDG